MTSLVRICRQLTNQRLTPERVRMMHRRNGDSGELRGFFGCDVEFGADCDEVMFAGPIGQVAIPSADPYLNEMLVDYCEEALAHRARTSGSFRTRVENAIVPLLPHGRARMKTIAETLGMSQRTLTRRLSIEGITFAEVLDELRSDLARRYLREADLKISEIAWLLGYGEVSAFTRAFKRWTGTTPRVSRFSRNVKFFRVPAA
jgi:AraC-like DNA-binding protein